MEDAMFGAAILVATAIFIAALLVCYCLSGIHHRLKNIDRALWELCQRTRPKTFDDDDI